MQDINLILVIFSKTKAAIFLYANFRSKTPLSSIKHLYNLRANQLVLARWLYKCFFVPFLFQAFSKLSFGADFDDSTVKNKFQWRWLDEIVDGEALRNWVRKTSQPGHCVCIRCGDAAIKYGNRGKTAFAQHSISNRHKQSTLSVSNCTILPGTSTTANAQNIAVCDRVTRLEATFITFLVENRLPFTMAPKLVDFAKHFSRDPVALSKVKLSDCSVTYKLREGLGSYWEDDLASHLQSNPFSLTFDESTSASSQRVIAFLVHLWQKEKVICLHLRSIEVKKVDAATITTSVVETLDSLKIPKENVISVHTDSCSVMRGSISGVTQRLKEHLPNVLDTGGDTPHTIHNASKHLSLCHGKRIEHFLDSLSIDQLEINQRETLCEISGIMGIRVKTTKKRIDNRWLSELPLLDEFLEALDPYTLFYSSFVVDDEKFAKACRVNRRIMSNRGLTESGQNEIRDLISSTRQKYLRTCHSQAASKKLARRNDIVKELFRFRNEFLLLVQFQIRNLYILNDYVKLMQLDNPLIHQQMAQMKRLLRSFCATFLLPNKLDDISKTTIEDPKCHILSHKLFFGLSQQTKFSNERLAELGKAVLPGLIKCAQHMLHKLPFQNKLLCAFPGIDPVHRMSEQTVDDLNFLNKTITWKDIDKTICESEIRKYCGALISDLPSFDNLDIDEYWNLINKTNMFPNLSLMVKAALTCFNGPKVEGSFTLMNMTSTEYRPSLEVASLSACLSAQYRKKVYGGILTQSDVNKNCPVDPHLLRCMRTAWKKRGKYRSDKLLDAESEVQLTEEGLQKRKNDTLQRKALLTERRKRLEKLIPQLFNRQRNLRNLPKIPRKRPLTVESEMEVAPSVNPVLPSEELPAKRFMTVQSDIRNFFAK